MQIIQINGTNYVSTRDIENHYGLNRKKTWQELQKLKLDFVEIAMLRFWEYSAIKIHFDNLPSKNK